MDLRHQHKNEKDVAADADRKDDFEVRPQWPGKKTLTGAQQVDARSPDLKRIRAAIGALRGGGTALPGAMTREYSQLLGLDLSDVRLHRGGAANDAARSLDATAFTHGTDIAVADHLDLDSAFGRHVIAHELVHVAQHKRSGGADISAHAEVGPSGSAIEQEAERGAAALTRGMSFSVGSHARMPGISRFGNDENPPTGAASPVPVPGTNPPPVDAPVRAQVPTPGSQPTQAQPAATPPPAPATPAATPAPQPRPTNQPTAAAPVAPAGTPGVNAPSGSGGATNPTAPASREPRPAAAPRPAGSPTPALSLDDRVKQELETRADPTLKAGYARAIAGVDSLRLQAQQFTFQPNGVWNTLVETFTAKNAFQDHFGQIYSTNAYRGGNSWADTAQAWIEGLRGVVHIIGDVASVISAWAGLAALVTGALALILSETVIGGIALGAIAAIAAEVAMVAGAIKLLTDIIDTILGVIQMIILIVRARNSKDPAQRARFAQLLHKEANDFGANVVSIGVQVAVMAVSAGVGAGLSRGANSFVSSFKSEFTRMITPALKPWTLGSNIRGIANMMKPAATGTGVRGLTGRNLAGQTVPRTVLNAEVNAGLIGVNRQLRVGSRITAARETIPFTAANQMRGARLVLMRRALISNLLVNTGGFKIGFGAAQLQADIKQPRASVGGTSSSSPSANGGRLNVPQAAGSDLSKVQMWPSQIELFENAKGPIQGTTDRTQRQYEMAEAQAGPELAAQVRTAFQGANNSAGQMRFGAMAVQTDAQEGQANTQRGLQQTQQAGQQRDQMGVQQNRANTSVQRINNEGAKLQSPPPKEGVLGWLYNQTIGRIGGWIGSAQKWVMNLVGKWAMSLAGFSKEEMDIAGIENDMREDDKKDQTSTQEAQDAALKADQIQQTVFQLQENKTRDEQYAIQGMADAQRFIQALEDADRQLAAAITNGQSYISQVSPLIAHELQTEEAQASIDAAYIAPVAGGIAAFTGSIDGANVGDSARSQGIEQLTQMKGAFPELDISQGTTAIGTALQTYNTAFGTLASSARTQAAALNTALQAFIGTQDYDGVTANAAALETLAADFQRQAGVLETQLFAAVQSVIDQYVTHIINAVTQAQQLPDEPDGDEQPPADQPPVQRKALSSAPVIAVQRKALSNASAPQQMQQSASADQPSKVPTDINNPAPTAPPAQANAADNANAQAPSTQSEAAAASANGAQVPGAAPNGATTSTPKDGLVGGATNTTEAPASSKGKPSTATPKQQANPKGADKAPVESENEAEQSITAAEAGSGKGSDGSDNASAPGAASDKPTTRRDNEPSPETAATGPTMTPVSNSAAPSKAAPKPTETKESNEKAAAVSNDDGGGDGNAPMMSGNTVEDGFIAKENKPAAEPTMKQSARPQAAASDDGGSTESTSESSENESENEVAPTESEEPAGAGFAVQRRSMGPAATSSPVEIATQATAGSGSQLPYFDTIQSAFGHHDVSNIRSHSGSAAQAGAEALNAKAFAVGDAVAFSGSTDLHTAAHEAAHVIQQRAGLRPSGGIDSGPSDSLEQHADRVADAVIAGRSAQGLLDQLVGGVSSSAGSSGVQRKGAAPTVTSATAVAVEGGAVTRTTVGVGEVVTLTSTAAGTWSATGGTASGAEAPTFEWTAPGKPGQFVVRVKTKDGEATKEFAVIGPSKVTFTATNTYGPSNAAMLGAGMALDMKLGPANVSFQNVTIREQAGGASGLSGYFATIGARGEDLGHHPFGQDSAGKDNAPKQTTINADNTANAFDDAHLLDDEGQPWPRPFSVGSMSWQIPYLYSCGDVTDKSFTIVTQTMSIVDSKGTVTIIKGAASHSRTPSQPLWQPPKKDTKAGKAGGSHKGKGEGGNTQVGDTAKDAAADDKKAGTLTHETQATAAGNSDNARTTVGVGEHVTFSTDAKGTWTATAVGPGGNATGTSDTYEWTAPSTAQSVTITLDKGTAKQSVQMSVIAPTGIDFTKTSEYTKLKPSQQGAGMITDLHFLPLTVSFGRTKWKEIGGPGSNAQGYFANKKLPTHKPNSKWLGVDDSNGNIHDTAAFFGHPSPWTQGSFDWVIPNHFLVDGESGNGTEFTKVTQTCQITDSLGTTIVTKGNATSAARAPTAPTKSSKPGSKGWGGKGEGGKDDKDTPGSAPGNKFPAATTTTWHGDGFTVDFMRTGRPGFDKLVVEVTYTGGLPTVGGPFVKGKVVRIEVDGGSVFYMSGAPVNAKLASQGANEIALDLYSDGRQIVKVADKMEPRLAPENEKGRQHQFSVMVNGRWITSKWIVVRDDKQVEAAPKPDFQEDIPGEAPKSFLKNGGSQIRIDGDGDQHKELLLFIKQGTEEYAPGKPKAVTVTVTQIASKLSKDVVVQLPKKDFGMFMPIVKQITDGFAPTQISLISPDVLLSIAPAKRGPDGKVTYTLAGPSASSTVEFPKEPEGTGPAKVAGTTDAPVTIGGIHSVDLTLGSYKDPFRLTIQPEQKLISFSAKERAHGVVGGTGMPLTLSTPFKGITVLGTDGISIALDLDGDGKADLQIYDKMEAQNEGVSAEVARKHDVRLVGGAIGEQHALFRLEGYSFWGPFARKDNAQDMQAGSNAQAVTGLQDQAALGSFQQNMDAFEGAMFASRKQAADEGIISQEIYTAWSTLNGQLIVLRSQIAGKKIDPAHQAATAKSADDLFTALSTATKGKERVTFAQADIGFSNTSTRNDYTGEEVDTSWTLFGGTKTTTNALQRTGTQLRMAQWDPAFGTYNTMVSGIDRLIVEKLKAGGKKDQAQRLEYLGTMRSKLGELESKNPTRIQAVFHPDAGYKEALRVKEVPLALYYWREGNEWKLRDLTNPNNIFTDEVDAKDGEKEPPATIFKELDYKTHFPKGIIHWQFPNGAGGQTVTTERRTFSEWLSYIGLGVAAIGLGLATFGTGTVAVVGAWTLAASSVIGAGAAAAHMIEEADHGNLSNGEMALDIAQIVAGLAGASQLAAGRLVLSAGAASKAGAAWQGTAALIAKWAQAGYVPLTITRIGADVVTVALGAKELAHQLEQIEASDAPAHEKGRLKSLLLAQFAATAGMVALSIKGDMPSIKGGKSLYFYTPKEGGPLVAAHFEKPSGIKFSQATIGPSTSDDIPIDKLVAKMKAEGWQGDPIEVVNFNGEMVSIDNRRLYAARQAGIEAPVKVRQLTDRLPADQIEAKRFKANADIYQLPDGTLTTTKPDPAAVPKIAKGTVAETWGDAMVIRTANQKELTKIDFPVGGSLENPFLTQQAPREANVPKVAADNDVARLQTKALQTEIETGALDKDIFNKKAPDGSTFGEWYKKWVSQKEPVKFDADGPGKHAPNYPTGMPKEFEPYLARMVNEGEIVSNLKINAQAKQLATEIPDLKTLDPNNAKYPETRKTLVDKHGEDVVKRYESAMFGGPGVPGREGVFGQLEKVVDATGLDTLRSYMASNKLAAGVEIYVTGGAAKAGQALSEVNDLKIMIIAPEGMKPTDIAKLEAWANQLVIKTAPGFQTATGKGHLRVNATVRPRKDAIASMMVEPGAEFARIDVHAPTTAEIAHGYQTAKANAGGQTSEAIAPEVVELLAKELPGLKINPTDPRPGIAEYLSREMNIPGLIVEPLGGGMTGAQVFKVTKPDGSTVGIFKLFRNKEEMLREIGSLQKLRDSGVKTMQPVGIGHAANVEGTNTGGALMEAAGGTIVKDRFKAVGKQVAGSAERAAAVAELKKDVKVVGAGMAEMHGKMSAGRDVDASFKAGEIKWFEDKWNTAVAQGTIPPGDRAIIDPKIRQLAADFRTAKVDATVVHGDGHAGNFSVEGNKVNTFDTETMFRSIGKDGKGTSPAATDVGRFYESIAIQGKQLGMAADEIAAVQQSFMDSYKAASPAASSPDFSTSMKFYQMNFDLILLRQAAKEAKDKGTPIAREAIDRVIDNLK